MNNQKCDGILCVIAGSTLISAPVHQQENIGGVDSSGVVHIQERLILLGKGGRIAGAEIGAVQQCGIAERQKIASFGILYQLFR